MAAAEADGRLPAEDAWEAGPAASAATAEGTAEFVQIDCDEDDREAQRLLEAQALAQALAASVPEEEATASECAADSSEDVVVEGTAPSAGFALEAFLGEWWDSMGHFVRVAQGSAEGSLDVTLTRKRGGRGPIKLKVTDQGDGSFVCGQYLLEAVESSAEKMVWTHRRLSAVTSTWMRTPPEDQATVPGVRVPAAAGSEPFVVDFEDPGAAAEQQPEPPRSDPYPYLTQYYRKLRTLQKTNYRYYAGASDGTDDGHPEREAMRHRCAVCLEAGHMARECPRLRCEVCFREGHEGAECGQILERESLCERLVACWSEALAAVAGEDGAGDASGDGALVRCLACGNEGAGHTNCVPGPPLPPEPEAEAGQDADEDEEMLGGPSDEGGEDEAEASAPRRKRRRCDGPEEEEEAPAAGEEAEAWDGVAADADEVSALYSRWGEPGEPVDDGDASLCARGDGSGRTAAGALEAAVLKLLAGGGCREGTARGELEAAPTAAVATAARGLWRSGAVVPGTGQGFQPQLTVLGHWLVTLPVPPSAACALLQGALWGVLLPMAALIVLLESVPPDLALSDGKTPPRKSGHFALATAYFRWREGRDTGITRRFGADMFWETVDERIVAICKHAQQALHYDGDDAAFEEMDGELMDVRRRDGRPWTCASAFGSEFSTRWARFRAALSAAFGPQPGDRPGEWVVRTPMGEGVAPLDTAVGAGHALMFVPGELAEEASAGLLELGGVRGTLCGGEGALEEARALRQELGERLSQALEGGGGSGSPRAEGLDEAVVSQVLRFVGSSASELMVARNSGPAPAGPNDDVGPSVLAMLGRKLDDAPISPGGSASSGAPLGRASAAPVPRKEAAILEMAASCLAQPVEPGSEVAHCLAQPVEPGSEADAAAGRQGEGAPPPPCPDLEDGGAEAVPGGAAPAEAADGAGESLGAEVRDWASALARAALARALKRKAVAAEDYPLAAKLKAAEVAAHAATAAARDRAGAGSSAQLAAAIERIAVRKRKAVEDEDYELAAQLKQQEAELTSRPSPPAAGELERIKAQKLEAIAQEDYSRAAKLREHQSELEASWKCFEGCARAQAAELLADPLRRRSLLASSDSWASSADTATWAVAGAELRSLT